MSDILNRFMDNTSEETAVDASKKVKVGIIGTGWIAEAHIRSYLRQPDVEIVAGADLVPGKADAFFKKFGVDLVLAQGLERQRCYEPAAPFCQYYIHVMARLGKPACYIGSLIC